MRVRRKGAPDISKTFSIGEGAEKGGRQVDAAIRSGTLPQLINRDKAIRALLREYAQKVTPAKRGARQERRRIIALLHSTLASYSAVDLIARAIREYRDRLLERGVIGSSVNRESPFHGGDAGSNPPHDTLGSRQTCDRCSLSANSRRSSSRPNCLNTLTGVTWCRLSK